MSVLIRQARIAAAELQLSKVEKYVSIYQK